MKTYLSAALLLILAACAPASDTAASSDTTTAANAETVSTAAAPANDTTPPPQTSASRSSAPQETKPMSEYENQVAVLKTTAGTIEIRFFPDVAPNHVQNFIDLAKSGFYNGTKFHRVIPGFMIQGGDPNTISGSPSTWGTGGSPKRLRAEFNSVPHRRGIVSMARSSDPNSASSQFFIVVKDSNFLDNQYTVFGEVVNGMDVADKIVSAPRDQSNDRPTNPVMIESITFRPATDAEKGPAPKA